MGAAEGGGVQMLPLPQSAESKGRQINILNKKISSLNTFWIFEPNEMKYNK